MQSKILNKREQKLHHLHIEDFWQKLVERAINGNAFSNARACREL